MRNRIMGAIVAGTLTFAAAGSVRAGCCDDFWGCVGTFFTAGLSCKAQQIIEATALIKKLMAAVDQTKANVGKSTDETVAGAMKAVEMSRSEVNQKTQQAMNRLSDSDQKLQLIITPQSVAPGGISPRARPAAVAPAIANAPVAVAPAAAAAGAGGPGPGSASQAAIEVPADPARLKEALIRAAGIVKQARNDAAAKESPAIQSMTERAAASCREKEPEARAISSANLISPLNKVQETLARVLAAIANPFDFTDVSKLINNAIAEINAKAPPTFDSMAEQMMAPTRGHLEEANMRSEKLDQQSMLAAKITQLSENAQKTGSKGSLDQLEAVIGKPKTNFSIATTVGGATATATSAVMATKVSNLARPVAQAAASRISNAATSLGKDWNALLPQLTPAPVMAAATVNQRMDAELAKKFQGQSRVDAEKTKAQLLTEARSRFANDPKTLASVENYLNQKTASIIQSAPAVAAPVAPAPTPIAPAPAAPAPGSNVSRAVR